MSSQRAGGPDRPCLNSRRPLVSAIWWVTPVSPRKLMKPSVTNWNTSPSGVTG
jgi:hypothetical protein